MNVVFDLGGVVVRWEPEPLFRKVFVSPEETQRAIEGLLRHPDWLEMDGGNLSESDAAARAAQRTGIDRHKFETLLAGIPATLEPKLDTLELVKDVKRAGNQILALSNMPFLSIEHLEREHTFFEFFDHKVISCRINKVKPDREIYEHLLNEYGLVAEETVFLDDTAVNLDEPARIGIHVIHFQSADQARAELQRLGCFANGDGRRAD